MRLCDELSSENNIGFGFVIKLEIG